MNGGRGGGRRGEGEGHLRPALIRAFTRSLGIADAGALLHLLGCPACAGKAAAELGFRPASRIASDAPRPEPYDALFERLRTRLATYQAAAVRRLRGDFARAGEAMREAERYLRQASDADERAAFCRELAELRRVETRYEEALALFERAAGLFGDYGQLEDQAAAWIAEGDLHLRLADPARALPPFESAARLAEEGLDAGLALSAALGAATALLAQGRTAEARRALGADLARHDPRSITLQQRAEIAWIEGRIAAAAG